MILSFISPGTVFQFSLINKIWVLTPASGIGQAVGNIYDSDNSCYLHSITEDNTYTASDLISQHCTLWPNCHHPPPEDHKERNSCYTLTSHSKPPCQHAGELCDTCLLTIYHGTAIVFQVPMWWLVFIRALILVFINSFIEAGLDLFLFSIVCPSSVPQKEYIYNRWFINVYWMNEWMNERTKDWMNDWLNELPQRRFSKRCRRDPGKSPASRELGRLCSSQNVWLGKCSWSEKESIQTCASEK